MNIKTTEEIRTDGEGYEDTQWVKVQDLKIWMEKNGLAQTTYSDVCWDDGDILFKKADTKKQGDWDQKEWDEKILRFKPYLIYYEELAAELSGGEKKENDY